MLGRGRGDIQSRWRFLVCYSSAAPPEEESAAHPPVAAPVAPWGLENEAFQAIPATRMLAERGRSKPPQAYPGSSGIIDRQSSSMALRKTSRVVSKLA